MSTFEEFHGLAEQGDPDAQYKLGEFFENENNISDACKWFEAAAKQNHAESQFRLGYLYSIGGTDFPADVEKSRFWSMQAARQGHPSAQYNLGLFCYREQNFTEAAKWFESSARQGNENAMFCFAEMNKRGEYQGSDIRTAVEYYTKLSEEPYNDKNAIVRLGVLYCDGDQIQRDANKGKKLIEKLKPFRDVDACSCTQIGDLYCTGKINPDKKPRIEDLTTGIELFNISIKDGLAGYPPLLIEIAKEQCEIAAGRIKAAINMWRSYRAINALCGNRFSCDDDTFFEDVGFDDNEILEKLKKRGLHDVANELKKEWADENVSS